MEPISFIVVCLALWGILQRTPTVMRQAASDLGTTIKGGGTPIADGIRQGLIDDGIEPTSGGPVRRFLGDLGKGLLRDLDRDRRARAAGRRGSGGWWSGVRDRADDKLTDLIDRVVGKPGGAPGAASDPERGGDGPGPSPEPSGQFAGDGPEGPNREADPGAHGGFGPGQHDGYGPQHQTNDRSPIRVDATLGDPDASPSRTATAVLDPPDTRQQLEGTPPMSALATRGAAVTGVISGAAEARSIQAALAAATAEYAAAVARARNRIQSMGEQTLSTVQMAGRSTVVQACAQAAEAIASAQSSVNSCSEEVIPLLGRVAREFDKRNS